MKDGAIAYAASLEAVRWSVAPRAGEVECIVVAWNFRCLCDECLSRTFFLPFFRLKPFLNVVKKYIMLEQRADIQTWSVVGSGCLAAVVDI
ncbi:hypothetical protein RB195_012429 [Necator americanus]|uniref:Uncharacterized protein n=1 Tax=Necator americanus TaxID=51031 RepID=A0ABR1D719_NECAM